MRQWQHGFPKAMMLACALSALACQKKTSHLSDLRGDPLGITAATAAAQEVAATTRFRDLYRDLALRQGWRDEDVTQQLFLPPAGLLTPPKEAAGATSAQDVNKSLLHLGRLYTPTDVYQHGLATPFGPRLDTDAIFAEQGPVTFVILPGLIEEVLGEEPFQAAINRGGSFQARYQAALAGFMDSSYDIDQMQEADIALDSIVHLSSLDDAAGNPRVQIIALEAPFGSTESIGAIEDSARIALRRLSRVFSAIPPAACSKIYLIGYSRGTAVALEALAQAAASPEAYSFYPNLRGAVSLGGVLFGTDLVDAGGGASLTSMLATVQDWKQQGTTPDLNALLASATAAGGGGLDDILRNVSKIFAKLFKNPWDVAGNLSRLQIMLEHLQTAVTGLSTEQRLKWWSEHTLPASTEVYSISASMPEGPQNNPDSPLAQSPYYGPNTTDYTALLRLNADQLFEGTGISLNDSQVVETKERLWGSLLNKFNPAQATFPTYYMGIVGTHHWGIALSGIFKDDNKPAQENPFPRTLLLEAMGAFVLAPR